MDDLFKQIFNNDPDNRITFSDIRKHPIFAKHFPVVAEASKILYGKKFQPSKIQKPGIGKKFAGKGGNDDGDIRGTVSMIRRKAKNFPE